MKILLVQEDGTEIEITEAVQILYDCVHASMDWGSGFLDIDEVAKIVALADVAGFAALDETVESYPCRNRDEQKRIADRAKDARAMFTSLAKVRP